MVQMQREHYLAKQAFYKHELAEHREDKEKIKVMSEGAVTAADNNGAQLQDNQSQFKNPRDSEYNGYYTPSASMSSLDVEENDEKSLNKKF